ncbi:MAG: LysR family transcriptional regulator [Hydrogenophaga sp.]|uniref:LysR family transcriptional regulator n=1 Tax=Hydrogenophaga sp. TaxID=1904254 RepID=UPI0025BD0780|nr:LysR family transcriptional regulator [Hydrogenophaga sp.]MBU7573344.1 LysR family transcriptional regulator [Hydrogenophaga sp.]
MSRPTLLHIETALSVAHIGSFSGAARKLDATQPAISARVRELEAALGYRLFTRRGQRMELTVKGRQFLEQVEPLFVQLQGILNERESPVPASIRVGCGQIAMSAWLGKVIGRMQSANTRLRFQVSIGISTVLIPLLDQDKLDIAVTVGKIDYPGLHTERLGRRSSGMWVTTPDRWKKYASYAGSTAKPDLADLINCGPVWTPPLSSRLYTEQSEILRDHGGHMRNINTCDDSRVLADLIVTSSGLGYAQHVLIKDRLASGALVEIPGLPGTVNSDYHFVWREANLSPIVHMLMKLAKAESEQWAV